MTNLFNAPIGTCFTHISGAEDMRVHGVHWVKVANEVDVYGHLTGGVTCVLVTEYGAILGDEVLSGKTYPIDGRKTA